MVGLKWGFIFGWGGEGGGEDNYLNDSFKSILRSAL